MSSPSSAMIAVPVPDATYRGGVSHITLVGLFASLFLVISMTLVIWSGAYARIDTPAKLSAVPTVLYGDEIKHDDLTFFFPPDSCGNGLSAGIFIHDVASARGIPTINQVTASPDF